jgi:hypothetical protein
MNKLNEMIHIKKTIMLLVMSFLIVATADAQVQEAFVNELWCFEDDYPDNTTYFYGKIFSSLNFLQDTGLDGNQAQYQAGYVIACSL